MDRPYGNPLSPTWFSERMKQEEDARRREAFGAAEGDEVQSGATYPVEFVDPLVAEEHIYASQGAGPYRRLFDRINTVTFEDVAMKVFDECFDLLVASQVKYGPKNVEQQGLYGLLVRMRDDKLNRIQRALNGSIVNGQIVLDDIDLTGEEGDTLEDAYKDLANYAVISLILLRGEWGKPL